MNMQVDFYSEIQTIWWWVIPAIEPSREIIIALIHRYADILEKDIQALSPVIVFQEHEYPYVRRIISSYKKQKEKKKGGKNQESSTQVLQWIQKKVQTIQLDPRNEVIKEKRISYQYVPEIKKDGIYKKYNRKAIDLVKKWEKKDERRLWIFSVQENTWISYTRNDDVPYESTPSWEYQFCFSWEDPLRSGTPEKDTEKILFFIEAEKKSSIPKKTPSIPPVWIWVVQKVENLLNPDTDKKNFSTSITSEEDEALDIYTLLESGQYSLKQENDRIIFSFWNIFLTYNQKEKNILSENQFIREICLDIVQKIVSDFLNKKEEWIRKKKDKVKEKYIQKQLSQIQIVDVWISEMFESILMEDGTSFWEYAITNEDIFKTLRTSGWSFSGHRILDQKGNLHQYRVVLQKILYQDGTRIIFERIRNENSSFDLRISFERKNGSRMTISSIDTSPYYEFAFPEGIDYRIQESLSQVLRNILILIWEISRRSFLVKNTKEYRSLPDKEKMEAYLSGTYVQDRSWKKLPEKEREIRREAYARFLSWKGKIINPETGDIETRKGLDDIQPDTKIVIQDMSVKPGFTEEGSKKAYQIIRSEDSRLKRYLIKRIFSTLNNGTINGKRIFSNGMWYFFQAFWKELPENIRKELIEISQTWEGSTDRALEIQYGQKTLIDALIDYWEDHQVFLSINKPSYIYGRDVLDNIPILKLSNEG